jgi:hypothetical protein
VTDEHGGCHGVCRTILRPSDGGHCQTSREIHPSGCLVAFLVVAAMLVGSLLWGLGRPSCPDDLPVAKLCLSRNM